ncbi:hypothetical protein ABZ851_33290 [Streptomyces sp. NPDC047049]|uniref:hypothetical protein n=1 Tax=Streptomyces sp. NPDC047049 TaxID=3156688 RepID=UPI00340881F8
MWEAAYDQPDTRKAPHSLDSALRCLHHRAGSPSVWAIAVRWLTDRAVPHRRLCDDTGELVGLPVEILGQHT